MRQVCFVSPGERDIWNVEVAMKRKIIIDCDPGIDDVLAIMLALSMEELEVLALTIVAGNSPVEMGFENAKKILKQMNRLDVPVYCGERQPLKKPYVNALEVHGEDGLGGACLKAVEGYRQDKHAVDYLIETVKKERCSIISIGPMTNLAAALMKDEEAFSYMDELISMGGNFKSWGNISPVAEYNYWTDPDAAAYVYEAMGRLGKKVHMVGLDVTRQIVLDPNLISYMKRLDAKTGGFVEEVTKFYLDFHWESEKLIGCIINDPLAVAYFADRSICSGFEAYTAIATEGICIGQSVVDEKSYLKKEPNSVVLTQADAKAFFYLFFGRILGKAPGELELLEELC